MIDEDEDDDGGDDDDDDDDDDDVAYDDVDVDSTFCAILLPSCD